MARKPKLKVFTTPIGFHDVYVAAPSRAAALRAWGSDRDLFARGLASEVTDPALMKAALEKPGKVIRHLRGTEAEQFAALSKPIKRKPPAPAPSPKPPPRPSRTPVNRAEAEWKATEARHQSEDEAAKAKIEEAQRERRDLHHRQAAERQELQARLDEARDRYDRAMERWRDKP